MQRLYADLHVHIGQAGGRPVKITASHQMTVEGILGYARRVKGLDIVGIVDCGSPLVRRDIEELVERGYLKEVKGGGLEAQPGILLILGVEIESAEGAHFISYLPGLKSLDYWHKVVNRSISNPDLSTQRTGLKAAKLLDITLALDGLFVAAHAFTPHKGVYGCWVRRLEEGFGSRASRIGALELGLSADTEMAGWIYETAQYPFLSNSDAHSLNNIAREYNRLRMAAANFNELLKALKGEEGRAVLANYGMHPALGKYHRSYCANCRETAADREPRFECGICGRPMIPGVWDRIASIRDAEDSLQPVGRPPYFYRVPMDMIPGIGPKTVERLQAALGTEIDIMEQVPLELIEKIGGKAAAEGIKAVRENALAFEPGGGGKYGRVKKSSNIN